MQADPDQPKLEIDTQQVKARLDSEESFLLLDCREQVEYDLVHIEKAMFLPMSELQARLGELDDYRDASVVVYCHLGGRSLQVTHWLRQQGFQDVLSMAGGIDAWSQTVDPEKPRY